MVSSRSNASMKRCRQGRLGDRGGGDLTVGAGAILDHDGTLQPFNRCPAPRHGRGGRSVAGREADDQAQWTIGKIHRLGADIGEAGQRQGGKAGERGAAAEHEHEKVC